MLTYKGDLNVCLKFVSVEQLTTRRQAIAGVKSASATDVRGGELLVLVKQARNLTAVRSNGFSDPFCKWFVVRRRVSVSLSVSHCRMMSVHSCEFLARATALPH
jgi:Ca2+-dependent lipid-binding protein